MAQLDRNDAHHGSTVWPEAGQRLVALAGGEHLFFDGDDDGTLFEVVEGVVALYKLTVEGSRQVLGLRFPGELLGLGHQKQYGCSAVAMGAVRVRRIDRGALDRALGQDPELARRLLDAAMADLRQSREQLMIVGCRSAIGRVAAFLRDMASRAPEQGVGFHLPLTRTDMGDFLGLTLETVSRTMSRLKALGIIALPRHDLVVLCDPWRLGALADGVDEGAARGRLAA